MRLATRPFLLALLLSPTLATAQTAMPAAGGTLPQDLSLAGMVAGADWVVKAVLIGLAFASVLTWTVALAKAIELAANARRTRAGLATLRGAHGLADVAAVAGPCGAMLDATRREIATSDLGDRDGIKERAAWALERIVAGFGRSLGRGAGLLATIGATAPFVGLFGTVWGIMNAFIGISRAQTTNLAVVAPGIAEALLTTAIGLVAAIPAVVIYNMIARATAGQKARLADAVVEIMRLLSRDLGRAAPGQLRAAAE